MGSQPWANGESCEKTKGESCEETNGESCEKTKGMSCEETKGKSCEETKGESCEETKSESYEETKGKSCEKTKGMSCEETKGKSCEETKGESEETKGESYEETKVVKRQKARVVKRQKARVVKRQYVNGLTTPGQELSETEIVDKRLLPGQPAGRVDNLLRAGKMSSFSDSNLVKKFAELNNTQQSIQTLSLWLIHHRKHSKTIVQIWYRELEKAKPSKRLTFVYLANDVIQNSKKKGPEFSKDFSHILADAFTQASKDADEKMKASLLRVTDIWKERGVYDKAFIRRLKLCVDSGAPVSRRRSQKRKLTPQITAEDQDVGIYPNHTSYKYSFLDSAASTPQQPPKPPKQPAKVAKPEPAVQKTEPKKAKKNEEFSLRQEIEAMGIQLPQNVDAEELVQRLSDLENSASCDASVRERIAALPPEVSDISHLDKVQDRDSADKLSEKVDEAALLLNEYNRRLVAELEERKKVARMLRSFILSQQSQVKVAEKNLQDYKDKLNRVTTVRQELMSHIQNLPDLTLLPDVTGGLAPLPSAGDLFSLGN